MAILAARCNKPTKPKQRNDVASLRTDFADAADTTRQRLQPRRRDAARYNTHTARQMALADPTPRCPNSKAPTNLVAQDAITRRLVPLRTPLTELWHFVSDSFSPA